MGYCTAEDIIKEIGQKEVTNLTSNTGESIQYREDRLTGIIDNRTKFINGYLRGRYPLPFPGDTDDIIKKLCRDLVIYDLYYYGASKMPPKYEELEDKSIKFLRDIQRGVITLDIGLPADRPRHYVVSEAAEEFSDENYFDKMP